MIQYNRGWTGDIIRQIQARLSELGFHPGPTDGIFGGGTERAIRSFQKKVSLAPDGIVGPQKWEALFSGTPMPIPKIPGEPLVTKCLALTGSFETGQGIPECFAGVTGDFDGQGISFGVLQWNFRQGSLQALLSQMRDHYPLILEDIFADHYGELVNVIQNMDRAGQLDWSRGIRPPHGKWLNERWQGYLKHWGARRNVEISGPA